MLDAVRVEDVHALPGADPEAAADVLAELVDARVLQAVEGVDVLHGAHPQRRGLEAGEPQRLAVGDADVARAPLQQVAGVLVAQPVGAGEPAPLSLAAHREPQLSGRPDVALAVLDDVAEALLDASAGDRDGDEFPAFESQQAAAVGAHQQLAALGGEEREDLAAGDARFRAEALDASILQSQQFRRAAAHPDGAVGHLGQRAHRVLLGAGQQLEASVDRAGDAAIGAHIERAARVAPLLPHHFAGQAVAGRVDAPQAAPDQPVQSGDADPHRAFAILRRHPRPRSRQPLLGAEHFPFVVFAVEQAGVGGHPERALRIERQVAGVAAAGEQPGEVLQPFVSFEERPEVARRAGPDRALVVAHHRVDALRRRRKGAPLPRVLRVDRALRRRDDAALVGPHRRRAEPGRPSRRRHEIVAAVLEEEARGGGHPERAARRGRDRLDAQVRQLAADRAEAAVFEDSHAAVGADPDAPVVAPRQRGHLVRGQAVFGAEAVEAIAVVAIDAVLGGRPEEALAILHDGEDREIFQALLASVAAEGEAPRRLQERSLQGVQDGQDGDHAGRLTGLGGIFSVGKCVRGDPNCLEKPTSAPTARAARH